MLHAAVPLSCTAVRLRDRLLGRACGAGLPRSLGLLAPVAPVSPSATGPRVEGAEGSSSRAEALTGVGAGVVQPDLGGGDIIITGPHVHKLVDIIVPLRQGHVPPWRSPVEIPILKQVGVATIPLHPHRRDLLTLHPLVHQVTGHVLPWPHRRGPPGEIRPSEEGHHALVAVLTPVQAALGVTGLIPEALLGVVVRAGNVAAADATAASGAAVAPVRGDPAVALGPVGADLLGRWLGRERAPTVLPHTAQHLSGPHGLTALGPAPRPGIGDPPRAVGRKGLLHGEGRG
mmetsp:Transcript_25670/g.56580  ORF Transcript_25670/g.56580 Transcript_25670/m.56580 type:complete len:288 (-) Transcript_25670:234-1097(-)